jgi:hypothetical protein
VGSKNVPLSDTLVVETTMGRYKRIIGPQLRANPLPVSRPKLPSASWFSIAC